MTFIVYGPGIRDPIKLDTLFDQKAPERVDKLFPKPGIKPEGQIETWERNQKLLGRRRQGRANEEYAQVGEIHEEAPALYAHQVMAKPVITATPQTTVAMALQLLHQHVIRHLVVLNSDGTLVGTVSDRDIVQFLSGYDAKVNLHRAVGHVQDHIDHIMHVHILTAGINTDVRLLARLFVDYHISMIPIIDEGIVVGVITRSDMMRAIIRHGMLELWV